MQFYKNIKNFEKIFFWILFAIIFFHSVNIKTNFTNDIYTEYDDVGVISLHKGAVGDKTIKVLGKSFSLSENEIRNLNQSFLYPVYIAHGWTYAPGQYMVIPFLNIDNDKYSDKIKKVRNISIIISLFCSLIIFLTCLNLLKLNRWMSLLIFCIFSFSLNLNIYSNHMSPYMMYTLCTSLGVLICIISLKYKNPFLLYSLNTILIYFSYTNVIFYICFVFIEWRKKNLTEFIVNIFKNNKKLLLLNIVLLLPIVVLIFIKVEVDNAGSRGTEIDYNLNLFYIFKLFIDQLIVSINSIQTGFIPIAFSKINLYFLIFLILISVYKFKTLERNEKTIFEILLFYFTIWFLLYFAGKLPLDETRHSLIFFPVYLFIVSLALKNIKKINFVSFLLVIILITPSINLNKKILISKKNNFDYKKISNLNIKDIYTFSDTLAPLLYYENEFNIKNTDLNSFRNNFDFKKSPKQLLLVSQNQKFSDREKYDIFIEDLKKNYSVKILEEFNSNTYMPYNNYKETSTENGFYLYLLNKKNNN